MMPNEEQELPGMRTANGRKDKDGTAKTLKPKTVAAQLGDLMKQQASVQRAQAKLNKSIKETAEAAGYNVAAIKTLMRGHSSAKKHAELKDQIEQTASLFEAIKPPKPEAATDDDAEGETKH